MAQILFLASELEEFVIVLANIQEPPATKIAGRTREVIEHTPFELPTEVDMADSPEPLQITVSLGVAMYPTHGNTLETLLAAADNALYTAKHEGRNQVRLAQVTDSGLPEAKAESNG